MFPVLVLLFLSALLVATSNSNSSSAPLKFHELANLKDAVTHVFLDSAVSAEPDQVEAVRSNMAVFSADINEFHYLIAKLYRERCIALTGNPDVELYHVCDVEMRADDYFEEIKIAFSDNWNMLFAFPPGTLREAMSSVMQNSDMETTGAVLASLLKSQLPFIPYPEAIDQLSSKLHSDSLQKFLSSLLIATEQLYDSVVDIGDSLQNFTMEKRFLISTAPEVVSNQLSVISGEERIMILLAVLKMCLTAESGEESLMKSLNTDIWNLVQKAPLPKRLQVLKAGIICSVSSPQDLFLALVQTVLKFNPMVLLSEFSGLDLDNIKPIIADIAEPFLDGVANQVVSGNKRIIKMLKAPGIQSRIRSVMKMVKDDWKMAHYERVFFNLTQKNETDIAYGLASPITIVHPKAQYGEIPAEVMLQLDPSSSEIAEAFRFTTHSLSIFNPKVFVRVLLDKMKISGFRWTARLFENGTHTPSMSEKEKKLVKCVLESAQFTAKSDPSADPGNLTYKQKHLIHSVVFRVGSFKISPTTSAQQRDYIYACESVAKLFFPDYVEKLLTVVGRKDGKDYKNIEELFMCPFVDKSWLIEHYGTLNSNTIQDPTNLRRLYLKGTTDALSRYVIDRKVFDLRNRSLEIINLRSRLVALLMEMKFDGEQALKSLISEYFGERSGNVLQIIYSSNDKIHVCNGIMYCQIGLDEGIDFSSNNAVAHSLAVYLASSMDEQVLEKVSKDHSRSALVIKRLWMMSSSADSNPSCRSLAFKLFLKLDSKDRRDLIPHACVLVSRFHDLALYLPFDSSNVQDLFPLFYGGRHDPIFIAFVLDICAETKNLDLVKSCMCAILEMEPSKQSITHIFISLCSKLSQREVRYPFDKVGVLMSIHGYSSALVGISALGSEHVCDTFESFVFSLVKTCLEGDDEFKVSEISKKIWVKLVNQNYLNTRLKQLLVKKFASKGTKSDLRDLLRALTAHIKSDQEAIEYIQTNFGDLITIEELRPHN